MKLYKISDFLVRKKDVIDIEDTKEYKRLTIKTNNQGVYLRDKEIGANIGTKKQFIAKGGQFIVSKIDAMNGAFGIIPNDISEAIITGNFWTYDVNKELVNIEWFNMFVSLPSFIKLCDKLSSGTTHRKYLDENKFSNYELVLPSIEEQNSIVKNYAVHKAMSDDLLFEISKQEKYVSSLRQSILQQAVEGKLCEQDPTDEPASVLLKKIK
ncbi:MAG: restriction endonuclease subunit S, partial [Oscillospiraceae bacterium]